MTSLLSAQASSPVCPTQLFPPRPPASPSELASSKAAGSIVPLYTAAPAPVGVAYYGLSGSGSVEGPPSGVQTSSVRASITANATGIRALNLGGEGADGFAIQLDAVLTSVDLFGHTSAPKGALVGTPYEFWAQNVVVFYPSEHYMVLETNLWNFSGAVPLIWAVYAHGPHGEVVGNEVYISSLTIPTPIRYPFNLTLFLNSTVVGDRQQVNFSAQLVGPGESFNKPYDFVEFNSQPSHGSGASAYAPFTANGATLNPTGLPNDFELDIGGPGGGSQADLIAADASLGLAYWDPAANGGSGGYHAVPSAFAYGSETAETATGANVAWSDAPGGPGDLPVYATMSTGPTQLTGLWNASGPEGSYPVTIDSTPSNAFQILTSHAESILPGYTPESSIAPMITTRTLWLAPGNYTLRTELSEYDPVVTPFTVSGALTLTVTLVPDASRGIYTPFWAWENDQIAAIAKSGSGVPTDPYLLDNDQSSPLAPVFGLYNDYGYAVYPGLLFVGTTATTEAVAPPPFSTATNLSQFPGPQLPVSNILPYWFDNVSSFALVSAGPLDPWVAQPALSSLGPAAVAFYGSENDLVARCTFGGRGVTGLVFWPAGPFFEPGSVQGGGNTVWNDTFELGGTFGNVSEFGGVGLAVGEPNDLVYNNHFEVRTRDGARYGGNNPYGGIDATAFTSAEYPLSNAQLGSTRWNVTPEPASDVNHAPSFPTIPLSGNVLGGAVQGGNAWWDYGIASNPYNRLPFDDNVTAPFLPVGGDYAPLVRYPLQPVTLSISGLPSRIPWHLALTNSSGPLNLSSYEPLLNVTSDGSSFATSLPNGTYSYLVSTAGDFRWSGGSLAPGGTLTVAGGGVAGSLVFVSAPTATISFKESGFARTSNFPWCAELDGQVDCSRVPKAVRFGGLTPAADFEGKYRYSVPSPVAGLGVVLKERSVWIPATGELASGGSATLKAKFVQTYPVTFHQTGLSNRSGNNWSITISGRTLSNLTADPIVFHLPAGRHVYHPGAVSGYRVVTKSRSVKVVWYGTPSVLVKYVSDPGSSAGPARHGALPAVTAFLLAGALGVGRAAQGPAPRRRRGALAPPPREAGPSGAPRPQPY